MILGCTGGILGTGDGDWHGQRGKGRASGGGSLRPASVGHRGGGTPYCPVLGLFVPKSGESAAQEVDSYEKCSAPEEMSNPKTAMLSAFTQQSATGDCYLARFPHVALPTVLLL